MSTLLRYLAVPAFALSMLGAAFGQEYNQVNLVANAAGVAANSDSNLVNPWGLARGSGTPWWVADNLTGMSTLYNGSGSQLPLKVTIPGAKTGTTGTPTGIAYNGNPNAFLVAPGAPALYVFCTLDGMIVGWNHNVGAMPVARNTDGSSYTGLTIAMDDGQPKLYVANFNLGTIDIYNSSFQMIARDGLPSSGQGNPSARDGLGNFRDPLLPPQYVPFNVQAIGGDIVVTYALHQPGQLRETDGPGNGYVDIYSPDGILLRRLQHGNWLNAPWGVALAPLDFGAYSHDLLVGQFAGGGMTQSSGYIVAYDLTAGRMVGLLKDPNGNPISINGIWGISFGNMSPNNYDSAGAPSAEMYFTAGPNHGSEGLFGYLTAVSSDLTEGSVQ